MNYERHLQRVIEYIGKHLDEKLTLEQLSSVACFSKYHFHRLFTVYTGLSLQQYIRWLRLRRAAHQLIVEQDKTIIDIAINAGFESHESFTRAFKQACGVSPSEFRARGNWETWQKLPYCLPKQGEDKMNVEIRTIPERRLAAVEHQGDPNTVGDTVNTLVSWAKAQPLNLRPEPGEAFAINYNDPNLVPPEEYRVDFCITAPENLTLSGDIVEKRLPGGRYAVVMHKGSRDNIGDTVYALYRDWVPESGEELGDFPCIFSYYNFDHEVAQTELLTEVWLLLK